MANLKTITKPVKMYCPECNRTKKIAEFYTSRNLEKYPNGKLPICKLCRSLMVDNWKKETFIDILEDCDVPFIALEWNKLLDDYGKEPEKCTTLTILGRYLGKMQLHQYHDLRFADSEAAQQQVEDELKITMIGQGYDEEAIKQAQIESRKIYPFPGYTPKELPAPHEIKKITTEQEEEPIINNDGTVENFAAVQDYFATINGDEDDASYEDDLTAEDKKYLRLKWGRTYSSEELIKLEKLYREMEESFDIQNAGHRDTLVKVCKTSLKSEQLLDIGDVDGAQKMIKMYEALMKAGKFTAVQNKTENGDIVDSVSEIVEMCEKQGYIERLYVESPKDKVDLTLMDMQRYTKSLIEGETNLTNLIELAIKQNVKDDEASEQDNGEEINEDDLFADLEKEVLSDKDFMDFYETSEEESELDIKLLKEGGE